MKATRPDTVNAIEVAPLNGDADTLAVERAIAELRRGRVIGIRGDDDVLLLAALETLAEETYARLQARANGKARLAVSAERAQALGIPAVEGGVLLAPGREQDLTAWRVLAGLAGTPGTMPPGVACDPATTAALGLARIARLMPALLVVRMAVPATDDSLLVIAPAQLERYRAFIGRALQVVSRARVPLRDEEHCELVLFRDPYADNEHLAILVGAPEFNGAVMTRLHSACLTGDVLGSLRCDCGDQLRGAVARMSDAGGGVLLYLAQEGRGIGLANKLRAYALQDTGLDTYDADQQLGFGVDQRDFGEAAAMLRALGIHRIRLLTNNPHKVEALQAAGIEIVERLPLRGERNPHNNRYLNAKRIRAGHLVDDPGDSAAG